MSVRFVVVDERDPSVMRDSEGSPTSAMRTWAINPAAVRAITTEPELCRGDLVLVHLFGRKEPIPVCADADWLLDQLMEADDELRSRSRHVLRVKGGGRANKLVTRMKDGTIMKSGVVETGCYNAAIVPVPDAAAMVDLLNEIGEDPAATLMLGFFPEQPVGEVFEIWSRRRILRHKGLNSDAMSPAERERQSTGRNEVNGVAVHTRTRETPASGLWTLLDRDVVRDMPEELIVLEIADWLDEVSQVFPLDGSRSWSCRAPAAGS